MRAFAPSTLAASTLISIAACRAEGPCAGYCGPGTECQPHPQGERCVAVAASTPQPADTGDAEPTRTKRRKRSASGKANNPDVVIPNDRHVPAFDPHREQHISPGEGSERLSDSTIDREMAKLRPKFDACIRNAVEASDDTLAGKVEMKFAVTPTGKILGISVAVPPALRVPGFVPCLRLAVYGHTFPRYDGPATDVVFDFSVG